MANPFGEVVDNEVLEKMTKYKGKTITREDRALEAMVAKTGAAYEGARKYVDGVKQSYGTGASVQCMIFNATGETLYYVDEHDWYGNLWRTPYPVDIGNGQWVSFLHVHSPAEPSGCEAAVIYRGIHKDGTARDSTLAWSTPFSVNNAYCEVQETDKSSSWDDIYDRTNGSDDHHTFVDDNISIEVSTVYGDSSPIFTALLTLPKKAT